MAISTETMGLILLLFSLLCLGTWPALLVLSSGPFQRKNPKQLALPPYHAHFQNGGNNNWYGGGSYCCGGSGRNNNGSVCFFYRLDKLRNVCHVYLDYATAYFLTSYVPLSFLILFSPNEDMTFLFPAPLLATAMLGGALLSMGNLAMLWATAVHGASLTFVLAIQASLSVLSCATVNYILEPDKTLRPNLLLSGGISFLITIMVASGAQLMYQNHQSHREQQNRQCCDDHIDLPYTEIELPYGVCQWSVGSSLSNPSSVPKASSSSDNSIESRQSRDSKERILPTNNEQKIVPAVLAQQTAASEALLHGSESEKEKQLIVDILPQLQKNMNHNSKDDEDQSKEEENRSPSVIAGLFIAVIGGICFGCFAPCLHIAVEDPLGWTNLSESIRNKSDIVFVERANLWFSFSFWITSIVGNTILLHVQQHRLGKQDDTSTFQLLKTYFTQDSLLDRQLAVTAGLVCALGNVLLVHGKYLGGYVFASLVSQAYPLISTFWDILLFGEFHTVRCPSCLGMTIAFMYLTYFEGVLLCVGSTIPGL